MFHLVWTAGPELDSISHKKSYNLKIECNGKCRNLNITESTRGGDVDLYGKEDTIPDLSSSSNSTSTYKCRSSSSSGDSCSIPQTVGNTFFLTIYVYRGHVGLKVTVTCENLSNIVCVGGLCEAPYQLNGTFSK